MTTTHQLLQLMRDGDVMRASALEEIGPDVAHVRFVTRQLIIKPFRHDGDEDEEPETREQYRLRVGDAADHGRRRDWLAWQKRASVTLGIVEEMLKRVYSDAALPSNRIDWRSITLGPR